jgi:hypothetical protein
MAVVRVKPADLDVVIANAVAARTGRPTSHVARALTSRADEHVLRALAFGWWLYAKSRDAQIRHASDHVLLTTSIASALPHALKARIRSTATGPARGARASSRRPAIGDASGRFPVRTRCPHRRLGVRSNRAAARSAKYCLGHRGRSCPNAHSPFRPLDKRCRGWSCCGSSD